MTGLVTVVLIAIVVVSGLACTLRYEPADVRPGGGERG